MAPRTKADHVAKAPPTLTRQASSTDIHARIDVGAMAHKFESLVASGKATAEVHAAFDWITDECNPAG
jgi:hypothetical protein